MGCNDKQRNNIQIKTNEYSFFDFQKTDKIKSLEKSNIIDNDELCLDQVVKELNVNYNEQYKYSLIESEFQSWEIPRKIYYDIEKFNLSADLKNNLNTYLKNNNPVTLRIILLSDTVNKYIIFIGKNLGATGIGVRYNNYFVINLSNSIFIQQDSITENPFSVFIDENERLNIIILDENFRNENSFFYSLITVDENMKSKVSNKKVKFVCN